MEDNTLAHFLSEKRTIIDNACFSIKGGKKIDIYKEYSQRFKKIVIVSDVNVNLSSHNAHAMSMSFHGKMPFTGNLKYTLSQTLDENCSALIFEIHIQKGNTISCSCQEISIDIELPQKLLEGIYIFTDYTNMFIAEFPYMVTSITLSTNSGYMESYATFTQFKAFSNSGDCDVFTSARKNISISFKTNSGNFLGILNNVGAMEFNCSKTTGIVRNRHIKQAGLSATVNITSNSGDIKIH